MAARARLVAPLALAALSAAAALTLARVFDSGAFVGPVLVAALLPHVVGALARERRAPSWADGVLGVMALAVYVVVVLERSTTWFGLPTADTLTAVEQHVRSGWHELRTIPAPAPVTAGTRLLAVLAVWVTAGTADRLAFRRHTALAATAPALVLFVWSSTLGTADHQAVTLVAFGLAVAAFLTAQNLSVLDRRRAWLVSQGARPRWRARLLAPAAFLTAGALVAGLVLGPAVPGASDEPLLDFTNTGRGEKGDQSYSTTVPPLVDVGQKLREQENYEVFRVRAAQGDYWRLTALDELVVGEGAGQWTLRAEGSDEVETDVPGTAPSGSLAQDFRIGHLGERWLPAAYRPLATDTPALMVRSSNTLVSRNREGVQGLRYRVYSNLPPQRTDVDERRQDATVGPVPAELRRYTALPPLPAIVTEEARRIVAEAGATTPFRQAEALRDYFWANFDYDVDVELGDDVTAVSTFLRERRGFCVQFASTYAMMARWLGIPARVAVGFTQGELVDGEYRVRAHDAHAWPEIWLAGLGWTHLFDPTPPAGTAPGGSSLPGDRPTGAAIAPEPPSTGATVTTTVPAEPAPGATSPVESGPPAISTPTPGPTVSAREPGRGTRVWLVALGAAAGVLAIAALYVGVVVGAKARRRTRRRGGEPARAVVGAWEEALDRLREARVAPDPALTPLELARSAPGRGVTGATRPLRRLARVYTVVRYGTAPATGEDAARAWESVDDLDRALGAARTRRERLRRLLDPSTLRSPAGRR